MTEETNIPEELETLRTELAALQNRLETSHGQLKTVASSIRGSEENLMHFVEIQQLKRHIASLTSKVNVNESHLQELQDYLDGNNTDTERIHNLLASYNQG